MKKADKKAGQMTMNFGVYTTNDLPGCPKGGLLLGRETTRYAALAAPITIWMEDPVAIPSTEATATTPCTDSALNSRSPRSGGPSL